MDSLKKQRAIIKGSLTKLLTFVKGNLENSSVDEVYVKQERAQKLLLDFQSVEKAMLDLDDKAESDLSEFEDNYYTVLAALNAVIRKQSLIVPKAQPLDHTMNITPQQSIEVRLPKISIPTFDGDYMEWQSFFDIYTSTIHERGGLTAAQKFQYLRGLLKGEAASLIRHLPVTDANYNEAFQKLIQRYDRKRHTINAFIKTYMEQPSILQPNATNIRKLTDVLDESIRGLKALGSNAEKRDPWLIYIAINKLDSETRSLWAQETAENEFPTFADLLTFLGKRIDMIDSLKGYTRKIQPSRPPTARAYSVDTSSGTLGATCPICKQDGHRIYDCDIYKGMSADQRSEAIKINNRCFNCLNGNHRVHDCRSRARCQQCYRKHHTSLHGSSEESSTQNEHCSSAKVNEAIICTNEETDVNNITQTQTLATKPAISQTVLPTALIKIRDINGQFHTYRALLDSASQASFVSEACMSELRVSRSNKRILVKGLGETRTGTIRGSVDITIASVDGKPVFTTQALIISKVSEIHNQFSLSEGDLQLLKKLQLADPAFNKRGQVDVLLGVDVFFKALLSDSLNLPSGLTAVSTTFGWIVAGGNITNELNTNTANNFNVLIDIDRSLRKFWEVEEIPIIVKETAEELKCEEIFQSTTKHDKDNRFIVKLPFKQQGTMIGTSYNAALNRLKAMEKRFERDTEFGSLYKAFMREYEELGHMQNLPWHRSKTNEYYLPHHGLLKAGSATTKLRVVFDASAKSSTGLSLNDMLMVGPTIQPPLIEILIRFRQHEFVVCGDIEKMYRQVLVDKEDYQYQNILWRTNPNQPPVTYQLKTLTYGTASAAFLATRCLKEVGVQLQSTEPKAARIILQDMYVDDMMTGTGSIAETKTLITQVKGALANNGFQLRKFLSNNEALRTFLQNEMGSGIKEIGDHAETPKVLGLQWDTYEDSFQFTVQLPERAVHTKRTLLSDASRNFDPLGWLNPVIIRVKILFQSLWMQNLTWDDELPSSILISWLAIRSDLTNTSNIKIPRWLQTTSQVTLIGFSDASEQAYAAVVYVLVETNEGLKSNIIAAKSRVAPIKQISLPRLELMGAMLLANLMKMVEGSLTLTIMKRILFTDSKIVLDWLSTHPRRWTTFVANRVSEITQMYKREYWCHVASKDNPADIASRGATINELSRNKLWWHGPNWLTDEQQLKMIQSKIMTEQRTTTEEIRPSKVDAFTISTDSFMDNYISRYSSFFKMSKVLSLIRRYINNLRNKHRTRETCREEIDAAEMFIILHIQKANFPDEIDALRNKQTLPKHSRLVTLNPFLDDKGVIRVGGRIQKSCASFSIKHPIILPMSQHAVKCLVRETHIMHNHPGVSLLTSIIRRRFWIIKAKVLSRAIVQKCIKCIKQNPKLGNQIMGNLPAERVQFNYPFHTVGVDYCGPFRVQPTRRRGQVPMKAYVCVFVCLSTKAVHIETVCDLTTESFLGALTRLISRRGNCHTIYSDNATNFVGANNHLRELWQFLKSKASDIAASLLQYKIKWKFIPPGTPHMGGIWEAAVKQAKIHLGRVVGDTILTLEEFSTLLTKIEAMMNSRPLVASQAEDIDYITPAHFLIGRAYTDLADENVENQTIPVMARWRLVKQMQQRFWTMWHRDYVTTLQKRYKWSIESVNIAIGDVVLIAEASLPSTCWALGKVVETHPGNDGKVRIVGIRMANTGKIIQRSIHKLCRLPIHTNESDDSWPAEC